LVIGITGGIGSGKSLVTKLLQAKFGAAVIDTDTVGHEVMEIGTKAYNEIVDVFGKEVLSEDKSVDRKILGDKVFGTIISDPGLGTKKGALATEICVSESEIALKPENIDMNHAATMGVASLTVGGAFRRINLNSKDVVVISAASGGIGSIAVQYAVAKGATVIGIASKNNAEYLESLGAIPVSYEEDVQKSLLSVAPKPITKFLDCYGGDYVKLAFSLGLKGTSIGTLVPSPYVLIRGAQFTGPRHSTYDDFKTLEEMVSDGKVQLNIEKEYSFSLESVREAYRSLKLGHTRGKRIIKIRE